MTHSRAVMLRRCAQWYAGIVLADYQGTMVNFCQSGRDLVSSSDLVTLGEDGPFRLTIRHLHGVIVEYFPTIAAALHRQGALEDMLSAVAFHGAVQIPKHTDSLRAAPNALLLCNRG